MGKKAKVFEDVTFCSELPQKSVAEHEIFMSFNHDADAATFYEWWMEEGARFFEEYRVSRAEEAITD